MSIDRMLRCFPMTWRVRYEAEVRELLAAMPLTWAVRRDLGLACVDAWGREVWSWSRAAARVTGALGMRLAALLAVGWIVLQSVHIVAALEITQAAIAAGGLWLGITVSFRLPMVFMYQLFVVKPYADSGATVDRPSWTQTLAITTLFIVMAALDARDLGSGLRQAPDMLILGSMATMRYARWFVVFDRSRPPVNPGRRVLGLQ